MLTVDGLRVDVSPFMVGSKRAVLLGGVIYVSPAMWELLTTADPDELQKLVAMIGVLQLPPLPSVDTDFPVGPFIPECKCRNPSCTDCYPGGMCE